MIINESHKEMKDTPDIRWMKMLMAYLPENGIQLPQNPNVLNIGCGNSVKWNYLGVTLYLGQEGLGTPHYVGVDLNEEAFADAKRALGELVHFLVCDAQNLTDFLKETYHLVVFEHPNLTTSPDGPKIWRKIFQETAKLLHADGGLILTSFWLNDHIPAQVALERTQYHIMYNGRNSFPGKRFDTATDGEFLEHDKFIIIAKKALSWV
jgi:SAM-dependent methyltransferase